jgi:hypothetical protein
MLFSMVIFVVLCVLLLVAVAMFRLDAAVDPRDH